MFMADEIRRVDYFYVTVPNAAAEATRISRALSKSGVSLLAFSTFRRRAGRCQLDFIPEDSEAFVNVAKDLGLKLNDKKRTGFLIQGKDALGAMAGVLDRLADANIEVISVQAVSAGGGRFGALVWVKAQDLHRTANELFASQFNGEATDKASQESFPTGDPPPWTAPMIFA